MDSEKRRPSCLDQFDRRPDSQPQQKDWIESFIKRLRDLLDRIAGKK
jgi:hypothetical protein